MMTCGLPELMVSERQMPRKKAGQLQLLEEKKMGYMATAVRKSLWDKGV